MMQHGGAQRSLLILSLLLAMGQVALAQPVGETAQAEGALESALLVIRTQPPVEELTVTVGDRAFRATRPHAQSPYLMLSLSPNVMLPDGSVALSFSGDLDAADHWGVYLLPGWAPEAVANQPPSWLRRCSLAFHEGTGRLPERLTLERYALPDAEFGQWPPPSPPAGPPAARGLGDGAREPARPGAPMPSAADRFAQLPRFGMEVFAAAEAAREDEAEAVAERDSREAPERISRRDEAERGQLIAGQAVPPSYIIGPGDELAVRVWTEAVEHIAVTPTVDAEGKIYLELVGEVTVGSKTLGEIREMLTERYHEYFDRAQVSVALARTRVIEVRVTGDAMRPGTYRLSGASTVFSALYAAGGPSEIGSLRRITLHRRGQEPRTVDLYDYLLEGDTSADVLLEPDDTVFIPPAGPTVGLTGEVQRPGRYELEDATTVAEALEMAGGLTSVGHAGKLQIWRVGESGRRHLLNVDALEESESELQTRAGDLIVVAPVLEEPHNAVELYGAVARPGYYEFREGMTVAELLDRAQGVTENAHIERAWLWRLNEELDYEHISFDLGAALSGDAEENMALRPRDQVVILSEEQAEAPMEVEVTGAVRRPGIVPWREGMRVSDLITETGGLLEGAYTGRADLQRLTADQRREIIPVRLAEALDGEQSADLRIERGDVLRVLQRSDVTVASEIEVEGYVNEPGRYPRLEGMRVSDALIAGGGLAPNAGDQVQYTPGGARTEVESIYLSLQHDGATFTVEPDPVLEDNDLVTVLGMGDLIGWPKSVTIRGRVAKPGTYALQVGPDETDTVFDLVQRAGGLLPNANPNGIVLYRLRDEIIGEEQSEDLRQVIAVLNRELAARTVKGEEQREAGITQRVAEGLRTAFSEGGSAMIVPPRRLTEQAWARAVPIDGERMLATNGEDANFDLAHGDVVVVPEMPSTVTVFGAVVRPGALVWKESLRPTDYINNSGGPAPDARLRRTVVIRANGAVEAEALKADIRPGDIILVPSDYMVRRLQRPSTFDRVLDAVGAVLGAYLLFD
ncbi:MAG: SLBB domain-containing protein [Armatimonadota bacterium]|nr:SLBB domain-containing protein [Armatimonadota bacterium]